jgi:hypothetical protein
MRLKPIGSGSAELIVTGKIIKSGGTSSQFLKADGSVDSNSYYLASNPSAFIALTALSGTAPIQYNNTTGAISITQASGSTNGFLSSTDWTTFNNKQAALNGTGFVKISGTTISYDNSTYLTTAAAASTYVPYTGATSGVDIGTYTLSASNLIANGGFNAGALLLKQSSNAQTIFLGYTAITPVGNNTLNFGFSTGSGVWKNFTLSSFLLTDNINRTYTLPDASGTIALVGGSGVGTVTSVAALTLGTSGTDLSSTVANGTTTPVITLNVPTASAANRGALSAADWTTFNNKQNALTNPVTGTGTTNYLPKFTGSTTIGNSSIIDNGTGRVSIGTTSFLDSFVISNAGTTGWEFSNTGSVITYNRSTAAYIPMTFEASNYILNRGNLGLGVTPSAWIGSAIAFEFGTKGEIATNGDFVSIGNNRYINTSGQNIYKTTDFATTLVQIDGQFQFYTAPSGTAGNAISFTQAMTLDASGNLLVGTTSAGFDTGTGIRLDRSGQATIRLVGQSSGGEWTMGSSGMQFDARVGYIRFITGANDGAATERMRITSGGNVGIGIPTPANKLDVVGDGIRTSADQSTSAFLVLAGSSSEGRITVSSYGGFQPMTFYTGGSERMRITAAGRVLIGTPPPTESTFQLDVNGTGRFSGGGSNIPLQITSSNSNGTILGLTNTNSSTHSWGINAYTNGVLYFQYGTLGGGSNPFFVTSAGAGTFSSSVTAVAFTASNGGDFAWGDGSTYIDGDSSNQFIRAVVNNTERLRINPGGNVGIGTNSPTDKLEVAGSVRVSSANFFRYDGDTGLIGSASSIGGGTVSQLGIRAASDILFATNGANERMRITSGGNVGIGTTSPTRLLEVLGSSPSLAVIGTSGSVPQLQLVSGGVVNWSLRTNQGAASDFTIYQDSTERIRITSTGNVGIGTTAPSARLHIGESGSAAQLWLQRTDGYNPVKLIGGTLSDGNGFKITMNTTDAFAITSGGNVLIGTTTDNSNRLRVNGTGWFDGNVLMDNSVNRFVGLGTGNSNAHISFTPTNDINFNGQSAALFQFTLNGVQIGRFNNSEVFGQSVRTTAPTGGSAENWKLGNAVNGTVNANRLIRVEIAGVGYDLVARQII